MFELAILQPQLELFLVTPKEVSISANYVNRTY